jgi:transposase
METSLNITRIERSDDIPLLLAQMQKMDVAALLDKHFPTHGNWQGLSLGTVVVGWLAYILSEGDHRLNSVQGWAAGLLMTLAICLKTVSLRDLDFSDDRLCLVLDHLGRDDAAWESYESKQIATLLRVYDLKARRVRIDSTTAKSYVAVTEGGLFQFGHSKEHRPDLPQLKINMAVLDPLGLPLSITIVSGERADDPLYVPEIRKVQASLGQHGVLYVGDCKMAALGTRAYLVAHADYYLCPLPAVQMPAAELRALLEPVWAGTQPLIPVHRAPETAPDQLEHIANGFSCSVTLKAEHAGESIEWQEQRLVVQSLKHAIAQKKALDARLEKAEQAIKALNQQGRGRKRLDEEALRAAVASILTRYDLVGLLAVDYYVKTQTTSQRVYLGRPAQEVTVVTATVSTSRAATAYDNTVRCLGWRVFVCNDTELGLGEAVLAYREEYIVEHGFSRLRGKILGLTPLYLTSTTRIKGLIRMLSIGLRVLCLIEFTVRKALQEQSEKLDGIYAGNPKRATVRPTTEMMLRAFIGIHLVTANFGGTNWRNVPPLNTVQSRILVLLGFPAAIYQALSEQSWEVGGKMGEP